MRLQLLILGLAFAATSAAQGENLLIKSFDAHGRLTFGELATATTYRVDWTTNIGAATWNSNAPGLALIPALGAGDRTVTVGVVHASCYYRVVAQVTNTPATNLTATFDTDNQGWHIVDYPFRSHIPNPGTMTLPYDGAFGDSPGSVRVGDVYPETGIAAPAAFLGDKHAFYGGIFSYDIYLRYTDGVTYPAVVLNGGTTSLYYDAPSPPVGAWQRRTVPLTEAAWKVSGTGTTATEAVFKAVLNNLVGLYIYTEWNTGPDDTSVDNIALTPP